MTKREKAIRLVHQLNGEKLDQAIGMLSNLADVGHHSAEKKESMPSISPAALLRELEFLQKESSKYPIEDFDKATELAFSIKNAMPVKPNL